MKIKLFFLALFSVFIFGQVINFPDANLKSALLNHHLPNGTSAPIDLNGDGEIQISEATSVTGILNIEEKNISNFSGLENFTNISELFCGLNQSSQINLNTFTKLQKFNAIGGFLQSLDFSSNPLLKTVVISFSQVSSVNLASNPLLEEIYGDECHLSSINLSGNSRLIYLSLNANTFTQIDVGNLSKLRTLNIYSNQLTQINVTGNPLLEKLNLDNNLIYSINLSQNSKLKELTISGNNLGSLNVSTLPQLFLLSANSNQITNLNLSQNLNLETLNFNHNSLSQLDISTNTKLKSLDVKNNSLNILSVSNSNNSNFTYMNAQENPLLRCIQIDENFTPTSSWYKDLIVNYSTNCSLMTTENSKKQAVSVVQNTAKNELIIFGTNPSLIEITDANGRIILNKANSNIIDISRLEKGIYWAVIYSNEVGNISLKWIKN